jgi:hypothetical protein
LDFGLENLIYRHDFQNSIILSTRLIQEVGFMSF